jgi:hypothetical protein
MSTISPTELAALKNPKVRAAIAAAKAGNPSELRRRDRRSRRRATPTQPERTENP